MESLGINPVLLIAQLISFTILYLVLNRFLYPVIKKALDERRDAVAKTFSDREEVKRQLEEFTKDQQKEQQKTLEETRRLLDEARKSANASRQELLEQAQKESKRLVEKAQQEIERNQAAAREEVAGYAKQLARQTVDSLLSQKASDPKWQKQQMDKSLKMVAAAGRKKSHE